MAVNKATGDRTSNPSTRNPVNLEETRKTVLNEVLKKQFNPDYHQVVLRVSSASQGLFWGAPPGTVL